MAASLTYRRRFNPVDQVTLAGHKLLRSKGYAGFLCQMHVWLDGRVDADRLRRALVRLGQRYPVLTSRLAWREKGRICYWECDGQAECQLQEAVLPQDDEAGLLRHAEQILAQPVDLEQAQPVSFHLLRRPSGGDLLLVQYDHTMIDTPAVPGLLEHLDEELQESLAEAEESAVLPGEDAIECYLRRFTRRQRWGGLLRFLGHSLANSGVRPVVLASGNPPTPPAPGRLILRRLSAEQVSLIRLRLRKLPGFPGVSMALLASAFRALKRLSPHTLSRRSVLQAPVGVSLRSPGDFLFQNLVSQLKVRAKPAELDDRNRLISLLNQQLLDQLRRKIDLGAVQMTRLIQPLPLPRPRVVEQMLFQENSMLYGYFNSLVRQGARVCGTAIDRVYHTMLSWSPPGLTLAGSETGDEVTLLVCYSPDTITGELAERFADQWVMDAASP